MNGNIRRKEMKKKKRIDKNRCLEWSEIAEKLAYQTFQLRVASSWGTAFLVSQALENYSKYRAYCFATAWHVIKDILKEDEFVLFRHRDKLAIGGKTEDIKTARLGPSSFDLGFIFVRTKENILAPEDMMSLGGFKTFPAIGEDLGWYGYPASLDFSPIFCRGNIACFRRDPNSYLINGIAYPGMSGSPVSDQYGWIIGVVSEWWEDSNHHRIPGMLQAAPSTMIRHVLEDRMGARIIDNNK